MAQGFVLGSADRPFDNILNLRDVGRSINGFNGLKCVFYLLFWFYSSNCSFRILREGVLFRSARVRHRHPHLYRLIANG